MFKIILVSIQSPDPTMQLAPYYLKAYFEAHTRLKPREYSISVRTFDYEQTLSELETTLSNENADMIGFTCYVWNITKVLSLTQRLKKKKPSLKTVLGGPEVSPRAEEVVTRHASVDIVVRGEGEETFKELAETIFEEKALNEVAGISFRNEACAVSTPPRADLANLDHIPSPFTAEAVSDFRDLMYPVTETMRGCSFRCHFCYYHKDFKAMRYYSLERVEADFASILAKRPKQLYIVDPTFNIDPRRAREVLKLFIRHNQGTRLHVELKAELLDREMIDLLSEANCNFIEIGIQSIHQKTLKLIHRTFDREKFAQNMHILNEKRDERNIQLQIIDSLPGETYEELLESFNWMFAFRPDSMKVMRLEMLPGTYLREHAEELGLKYDPNPPYRTYHSDAMSAEDIERIGKIRGAADDLYNSGLFRQTIHDIHDRLSLAYADIFMAWAVYIEKNNLDYDTMEESMEIFKRFLSPLCERHGKAEAYEALCQTLTADVFEFFYRQNKSIPPGIKTIPESEFSNRA